MFKVKKKKKQTCKQTSAVFFAEFLHNPNLKNKTEMTDQLLPVRKIYMRGNGKIDEKKNMLLKIACSCPVMWDKRNILFQQPAFSSFTEPRQTVS